MSKSHFINQLLQTTTYQEYLTYLNQIYQTGKLNQFLTNIPAADLEIISNHANSLRLNSNLSFAKLLQEHAINQIVESNLPGILGGVYPLDIYQMIANKNYQLVVKMCKIVQYPSTSALQATLPKEQTFSILSFLNKNKLAVETNCLIAYVMDKDIIDTIDITNFPDLLDAIKFTYIKTQMINKNYPVYSVVANPHARLWWFLNNPDLNKEKDLDFLIDIASTLSQTELKLLLESSNKLNRIKKVALLWCPHLAQLYPENFVRYLINYIQYKTIAQSTLLIPESLIPEIPAKTCLKLLFKYTNNFSLNKLKITSGSSTTKQNTSESYDITPLIQKASIYVTVSPDCKNEFDTIVTVDKVLKNKETPVWNILNQLFEYQNPEERIFITEHIIKSHIPLRLKDELLKYLYSRSYSFPKKEFAVEMEVRYRDYKSVLETILNLLQN